MPEHTEFTDEGPRPAVDPEDLDVPLGSPENALVSNAPPASAGRLTTEATELSEEDRLIFQSHWDEFGGHIN